MNITVSAIRVIPHQELKGKVKALEEKMKRWLLILGFLIVLMNQNAVTFLLRILGVLK
jgi:hypothetical protein